MNKVGSAMRRTGVLVATAATGLFLTAMTALAVDPVPETVVGDAAATVKSSILTVAGTVLPYAALLLAVVLGWRFARKFVRA